MKKILLLFLFVVTTAIFLFAGGKVIHERPSNIPQDAEWFSNDWIYNDKAFSSLQVRWYPNGNLSRLLYETENNKYTIDECYFENGKLALISQMMINLNYLNENHKKTGYSSFERYIGKQLRYHENGQLKEERCYTFVLRKNNKLENVKCGTELFYDEKGKEIKHIEYKDKCEYGCEQIQRQTMEQLIAKIKSYKDKSRNKSLVRLPVVGKITSVGSWSKEIEIAYKDGFALSVGDQVCCLIDNEIVSFECKSNENGIGKFELKEDNGEKYSSISKDKEPRFYKKNEIKYEEYLKSGSKPKAGDLKIIGGIEFVYIPAGEYFQYSDTHPNKGFNEQIKAFWMTKYEITLGEYLKYTYEENEKLPDNNSDVTLNSTYPVNLGVYHTSARNFCNWFGFKHGVSSNLPEVNEWEYAARAGTSTLYYWGNDKTGDYCWYKKNSGKKLHPVGQKKPNAFGLYDMIGNAWEWSEPYVIRGGGCRSEEDDLQYKTKFNIHYEFWSDKGVSNPYKDKTDQGTSFRMIIRVLK